MVSNYRRTNPEGDAFGAIATAGQRQAYTIQRAGEGIREALQDRCGAQHVDPSLELDQPTRGLLDRLPADVPAHGHVFHVCGLESLHGQRRDFTSGVALQHVCNTCAATWW